MFQVEVKVKKVNSRAWIPIRATVGSAGYDVVSIADISLKAGMVTPIPTGLAFGLPKEYMMDIRPRSGLSLHKVFLANSPGTLDSDYTGELKILLHNAGNKDYTIRKGDKIAQVTIRAVPNIEFVEVDKLDETERGSGGFGSTGR